MSFRLRRGSLQSKMRKAYCAALLTLCAVATHATSALAQTRAAAEGRTVRVALDGQGSSKIVLEESLEEGSRRKTGWQPVCSAPCIARIDETSALRIQGFGCRSRPFQLSSIYPSQRIDVRGRRGSTAGQIAGLTMTAAGGALWGLGFSLMVASVAEERRLSWWPLGMMFGGPVLGVAGVFELANSAGKLTFSLHAASPRLQR